ncbi:hypothetical protein NZL82_14115 [Sphingomonas sanguinis]|uniref:hypothetical protein n=1 Tax=Sphingomonas sp. LC-1 TaxID=3110957 RepID=UPI0021BA698F|nr:hypothetical protein [Sphingomonas sp. LC-1]MCT8003012.1 hypothetical protein [Sphingomonas sp. LC-1]
MSLFAETRRSSRCRGTAAKSLKTSIPLSAAVDQLKTFSVVDVSVGFLLKPAIPVAHTGRSALRPIIGRSGIMPLVKEAAIALSRR